MFRTVPVGCDRLCLVHAADSDLACRPPPPYQLADNNHCSESTWGRVPRKVLVVDFAQFVSACETFFFLFGCTTGCPGVFDIIQHIDTGFHVESNIQHGATILFLCLFYFVCSGRMCHLFHSAVDLSAIQMLESEKSRFVCSLSEKISKKSHLWFGQQRLCHWRCW